MILFFQYSLNVHKNHTHHLERHLVYLFPLFLHQKNLLLFVCLPFVFRMQPQPVIYTSLPTTVVRDEERLRLDIHSLIAFRVVQFELHVYNGVISYRSR
jgi:hypothetical protein